MTRDPREAIVEDVRPWGSFRQYAHNEQVTVKIIAVKAGEKLSLQRHQHRDELWVILDAGLVVEIGGAELAAEPGDEHLIPRGTTHRISGGEHGGRFLEVAFGDFDEDDIERLQDAYGRADEGGEARR